MSTAKRTFEKVREENISKIKIGRSECPSCGHSTSLGYCAPCMDEDAHYHESLLIQQYSQFGISGRG